MRAVVAAPRPGSPHSPAGAGQAVLLPGLVTVLMLAILIGLGVWQLQRLQWKRGILAAIDQAEASPAIPLPEHPAQFTKVRTEGRFMAGKQAR